MPSSSNRKQIPPNPSRWKPNPDAASIVVPGLNTDASVNDQIEQIEQLITIKLQDIDENFSKIHNALANKLLPAVKRYAVGTEPVREAAKFWTSFYEQAAQISIPTFDDYSTVNDNTSEQEDTETASQEHADVTVQQSSHNGQDAYETSTVNSETSFLPGQGAFSSTPAMARAMTSNNETYGNQTTEHSSWAPSMESPLVRLNREINNLSVNSIDDSLLPLQSTNDTPSHDTTVDLTFKHDASIVSPSAKGKGKDKQPMLRTVLRQNLYSASDNSIFDSKSVSPLKFRGKPKTPVIDKSRNPYLPEHASPSDWSGVVDLRDPSILTPKRKEKSTKTTTTTPYDDDDSSDDGLPPGMSPPVLMSPARPPRSSAELGLLRLGQTPARDASTRIQQDLLRDAQLKNGNKGQIDRPAFSESSMSSMMTPPSLSRYRRDHDYSTSSSVTKDSSLESMMRHIRNDIRPNDSALSDTTTHAMRVNPQIFSNPMSPIFSQIQHQDDVDSDMDSLDADEFNDTAHPSAAFLMASQGLHGQYDEGNSFGSSNNSSDSLADEDVAGAAGIVPVHPFAQSGPVVEDDGFDDDDESFDGFETQHQIPHGGGDYQEDTLFGLAPERRMFAPTGQLRMLGDELLQDTIGIGSQIAASGRPVEESPTPASWAPR